MDGGGRPGGARRQWGGDSRVSAPLSLSLSPSLAHCEGGASNHVIFSVGGGGTAAFTVTNEPSENSAPHSQAAAWATHCLSAPRCARREREDGSSALSASGAFKGGGRKRAEKISR